MRAFYGHCFVWLAFGTVAEERCYGGEGIEKRSSRRRRGSFFIGAVREEDVMTQRLESMEMNGEDDDNNDDKKEAIRSADTETETDTETKIETETETETEKTTTITTIKKKRLEAQTNTKADASKKTSIWKMQKHYQPTVVLRPGAMLLRLKSSKRPSACPRSTPRLYIL